MYSNHLNLLTDIIDRDITVDYDQSEADYWDSIALLFFHFSDYSSLCMSVIYAHYKSEPYLDILNDDYKIKAEYVEIFENALNN